MRITRPQMFMEIAQVAAKRSTCMRLNVGAIIVQDRTPISFGYNGAPSGAPHCAGNSCPGKHHCHETVHAEVNAIRRLPVSAIEDAGECPMDLYVTDSPCESCFSYVQRVGLIHRIFFGNPYRITTHLDVYKGDIGIYRVLPAGYVIDWRTKELVDVEA